MMLAPEDPLHSACIAAALNQQCMTCRVANHNELLKLQDSSDAEGVGCQCIMVQWNAASGLNGTSECADHNELQKLPTGGKGGDGAS